MAFGAIVPSALGSVTAPTTLTLGTATSVTTALQPWGLYDCVPLPAKNEVLFMHGVEAMRLALEGDTYRLGLLAPPDGLTAAGPARATATLTFTAATNPADGDIFEVVAGTNVATRWTFKSTLSTSGSNVAEIKIGANLAATIANIEATFNGTGTAGTNYFYRSTVILFFSTWLGVIDFEISATTATVVTFRSKTYGTGGNDYTLTEITDSGASWAAATFSGGGAATGTAPDTGDYEYRLAYLRSHDGALSAFSSPAVAITQSTAGNVTLDAFPALVTKDDTDHWRSYRTLVGGRRYFKVKDSTSDPVTDDRSDTDISGAGSYEYDERIFRPRIAGYPQVGRFGALWRGRLWVGGALRSADYTTGTASVTEGSDSVTLGSSARPKADMIGRTFRVDDHTVDYIIVDVDASTPSLTLNRDYEGDTDASTTYTIIDARNPFALTYSEPQLENNFPALNIIEGITSSDTSGITGLAAMWDSLVVFTKTGVWRVTGNTGAFRLENIAEGMGCFGNHAVQAAGGSLYWIGPDGVWTWGGAGDPVCLSKPKGGDDESGIQGTVDRINLDEGDVVVSNYNPSTQAIRWWLPLDGETGNYHCLRYDVQTRSFALQTANGVTAAVTLPGPGGSFVTVTGCEDGTLWQIDAGDIDGAFGFEPKATVTGYTASTRTITASGASFPTSGDGLKGVPVVMLPDTGPPYEMGVVASNTGTTLVLASPPDTAPAADDFVLVGAIPLDVQTTFDYEQPELLKSVEAVTLAHKVESAATEVWCGACADNDVPAVFVPRSGSTADSALMTATDGQKHFWLYTARGRKLSLRFLSFVRGTPVRLRGYVLSIRTPALSEVEG